MAVHRRAPDAGRLLKSMADIQCWLSIHYILKINGSGDLKDHGAITKIS
jgi:hypothetical protein